MDRGEGREWPWGAFSAALPFTEGGWIPFRTGTGAMRRRSLRHTHHSSQLSFVGIRRPISLRFLPREFLKMPPLNQRNRLIIAISLSFALTLIFQKFVWKAPTDSAATPPVSDAGLAIAPPIAAPAPSAIPVPPRDSATPTPSGIDARTFRVERPAMSLGFTNDGAGLTRAVLLGPRERIAQPLGIVDGYRKLFGHSFPPPPQVDMAVPRLGGAPQFAISISGAAQLSALQRYQVLDETPGQVAFATTAGPWRVEKRFLWDTTALQNDDPRRYLATLEVTIRNTSTSPATGSLELHATRAVELGAEIAPSWFSGIGNQAAVLCEVGTDMQRHIPATSGGCTGGAPTTEWQAGGPIHLVGIDQQYFLLAAWPKDGPTEGACRLDATPVQRDAVWSQPIAIDPGATISKAYTIWIGPKDARLLADILPEGNGYVPELDKTLDLGIWAAIAKGLIVFLRLFHRLTGNWGLAIILLTFVVKLVMLPVTHRAMVAGEKFKKLSPKMEDIRKKWANDKEKQNSELMKLYQEAKVNPLGGCLPLLIQLPIWGALFNALRTSYELYSQPFFLWRDLTTKDPTYLLPLVMGVTMIIAQRFQPQLTMDKSQAFLMTWIMPVFFTFLMMSYPAGLALYIVTNNLLSIFQQLGLRKWLERHGDPPGTTPAKA